MWTFLQLRLHAYGRDETMVCMCRAWTMFKFSFLQPSALFTCEWFVFRCQISRKLGGDVRTRIIPLSANYIYVPLFIHSFLDAHTSKHISQSHELSFCYLLVLQSHHHHPHVVDAGSSWNPGERSVEGCTGSFFLTGWTVASLASNLLLVFFTETCVCP